MTDAVRNVIATAIRGGLLSQWRPQEIAEGVIGAVVAASDATKLELAALLVPWRPAPVPEDVNCYVSADGRWWRYPLPGDPPKEENP